MSDLLLRYFTQAFAPLVLSRENPARAGFSKKINELKIPVKTWGLGLCDKLIR
ncbi:MULTISPECIES: hypothetical protein [Pseudomonas]|uniref:hypothetical protein n=1 Tax=Pseudomonas TaxID=286 RepID=UPI0014631081|nr:hypothetical protein [Pseudomonas sp. ADAK7]QJI41943.1 hypothetical protein HKK53_13755 [Pseudomonas sp. ADAK7]